MSDPMWDSDDDLDDEDRDDTGSGLCHHGVGFDEKCEDCEVEFLENLRAARPSGERQP